MVFVIFVIRTSLYMLSVIKLMFFEEFRTSLSGSCDVCTVQLISQCFKKCSTGLEGKQNKGSLVTS